MRHVSKARLARGSVRTRCSWSSFGIGIAVAAIATWVESRADAQPTELSAPIVEPSEPSSRRALKRHVFPYPVLQGSAFVTTHFGIRQGFIYTSVPSVPLGNETLDLHASGLVENADLGVKLTPWLGLFGTVTGQVTMGTDVAALILSGGSFSVGGNIGAIARVFRNEATGTQGSVRLGGGLSTGRNVSILGLVGALVATPEAGTKDVVSGKSGRYILVPIGSREATLSFNLAQAFTRHLGLQAAIGGIYHFQSSEPYRPEEDANVRQSASAGMATGAVALSLDGAPSHFPIAAMLEYGATLEMFRTEGETAPLAHVISAGLYYSGTPDVQVGVAALTQLGAPPVQGVDENGNPADSGRPSSYAGQFILRHIW